MSEDMYVSQFGWQWATPTGFTPIETERQNKMYGVARAVNFYSSANADVHLSWSVLNGPPVDYITDARFKSLAADRDPVNINRLADILTAILPPAGDIVEAHALKLPDHSDAIEMIQVCPGDKQVEPLMLYVLLFALEPPASERGTTFAYNAMRQFCDPVTNQLIVLSPVPLGEKLNPVTGEIYRIFQVGHDRYQRIIFSAPAQKFNQLLSSIKRAARQFHYTIRCRPARENWQDSAQRYHENLSKDFEELLDPPEGLRNDDRTASSPISPPASAE